MDFFDDELDVHQAGKGYFFTYLQVVQHSEVIIKGDKRSLTGNPS